MLVIAHISTFLIRKTVLASRLWGTLGLGASVTLLIENLPPYRKKWKKKKTPPPSPPKKTQNTKPQTKQNQKKDRREMTQELTGALQLEQLHRNGKNH